MTARRQVVAGLGPVGLRFTARSALAVSLTVVLLVVVAVAGLLVGDYGITLPATLRALVGGGEDPLAVYFVQESRAPRVFAALVVGAALGAAGHLFQNVTGNPLGSPDIIGFTTGAATGALVQILVNGGDTDAVAFGALLGGLGTAALVFGLTRSVGLTGARLVLVGIGVGSALAALNSLLMVRASLVAAQTAAQWLAGSLNAVLWPRATVVALAVAALLVPAVLVARPLAMLALGDDLARSAGIPVERVRAVALLTGVALVSIATAATGPIAFVALAAPQVARRVAGTALSGLLPSIVTGALIVQASDLAAQRLFAPTQLAVGVVTGAVGGVYLVVLLAGEWRKQRG